MRFGNYSYYTHNITHPPIPLLRLLPTPSSLRYIFLFLSFIFYLDLTSTVSQFQFQARRNFLLLFLSDLSVVRQILPPWLSLSSRRMTTTTTKVLTSRSLDYDHFLFPLRFRNSIWMFWRFGLVSWFSLWLFLSQLSVVSADLSDLVMLVQSRTRWSLHADLVSFVDCVKFYLTLNVWIIVFIFFGLELKCMWMLSQFGGITYVTEYWVTNILVSTCWSRLILSLFSDAGWVLFLLLRGVFSVFGDWERYCSSGGKGVQWPSARHKEMLSGIYASDPWKWLILGINLSFLLSFWFWSLLSCI